MTAFRDGLKALVFGLALANPLHAQTGQPCAKAQPGHLVVYGDIAADLILPVDALKTMRRVTIQANLHNGQAATFEGVTLRDILTRAGVREDVRSGDLSRYAVIEAADGYRALFSLAELDPAFRASLPIVADTENGRPLAAESGPMQVIVPGEIRHARWVRQVTCLRVARDTGS